MRDRQRVVRRIKRVDVGHKGNQEERPSDNHAWQRERYLEDQVRFEERGERCVVRQL